MGSANAELWEIENERLLNLLRGALEPGDGFLDVGANVGIFAIPVAQHLGPDGKVYAFEPAPDMAEDLLLRAASAGVADRLDVLQMALGDERATLSLRVDPDDPSDATKRSLFVQGEVVAEVPVMPLDDVVASRELVLEPRLQAVKIDVEGAEVLCLRGMRATLADQRPRLIVVETIESHLRRAGFELADIDGELAPLGYERLVQDPATGLWFNAVFVLRGASAA
jgi:FkbM family methyltransferase